MAFALLAASCGHGRPHEAGTSSTPTATQVPLYPAAGPNATLSSTETGRIPVDFIAGDAQQCQATRLYVGLVDKADAPKLTRLMSAKRAMKHVHIDDPTSGHMIYDLDGVVVTGKHMTGESTPTFTLRFASISVTGCGFRRH